MIFRLLMFYILAATLIFEFLPSMLLGKSLSDVMGENDDGEAFFKMTVFYVLFSTLVWGRIIFECF